MTLLRLLKLFFDDVLVDMIFEKADINFEITNEKIHLFSSMLLLSGCHKLPDRKVYGEATPDTFVLARSDSMFRNTFVRILRNLHLCDNEQIDK